MTPIGDVWTFAVGSPATVDEVAQVMIEEGINATILPAIGVWQHEREDSVLVRVAGLNTVTATGLARILRSAFKQEAVYFEAGGKAYLEYGHNDRIIPASEALAHGNV